MPNSSITLQNVIDYTRTIPELMPLLSVGGFSQQPAMTIANRVSQAMLSPSMNWKFNRMKVPVFYTNSYQQDYAVPGVVGLGWIEHCFEIDINNTSTPKPYWPVESVRDIELTSWSFGRPGQVCWLPNSQLTYGPWTANTKYGPIIGIPSNPGTALTQIQDPNGNLWVISNSVNQAVQTGSSQPTWPTSPVYPTYQNPSQVATTVADNTATWTAINPSGQGFRVAPLPPENGIFYEVHPIGQIRPPTFQALSQTLEPIPDDYSTYFMAGFVAFCYQHSKDNNIRGKFASEYQLWIAAMQEALTKSAREREGAGFYPSDNLMSGGWAPYVGPANPYYPGSF